jgi:tetrahydroxynaphthalene reductase
MALELGRRGAKVVVNYANSSEAADEVVAEIKKSGSDAIAIMANVSVVKDIISLFAQAVAHFGELNIVCSNSGVVSFGHIKDVTEEEYDRVMNINTRGQFFVAREAYKHLSVGGRLIMMGSITGQAKGVPKHTLYSGSKGAIETFIRCMAIGKLNLKTSRRILLTASVDMGDKKITVNCIAPGGIKTDMYHKVCREYIPNGENLNDEQVDEVRDLILISRPVADCANSMPRPGVHCTVLVYQLMLREWSVSLLAKMVNGLMERSLVLMVLLACRRGWERSNGSIMNYRKP